MALMGLASVLVAGGVLAVLAFKAGAGGASGSPSSPNGGGGSPDPAPGPAPQPNLGGATAASGASYGNDYEVSGSFHQAGRGGSFSSAGYMVGAAPMAGGARWHGQNPMQVPLRGPFLPPNLVYGG
jgi:hypothetical protein